MSRKPIVQRDGGLCAGAGQGHRRRHARAPPPTGHPPLTHIWQ